MKTNLKDINSYTRELNIIIEWEAIKKDFYEEFRQAKLRFSLPGFRKGKVPEALVKKNLGPSIEAHFAENSVNSYYKKALDQLNINPINQASIENLNFKEGNELSFSVRFEVHPDFKLPKYQKKINIKAVRYIPDEEDVKQALNNYREQNATVKTIESGAKSGHFIRGDFKVMGKTGKVVNENKLKDQYIRLGSGVFKKDAEAVFLGSKEGDEVSVTIQGKDKPLNYLVKVKRVEEQILPDIDDSLARSINEKCNTVEDLKSKIKEDLQVSLDKQHKELIRKKIINFFIDNSKLEAPLSMVTLYLDKIKEDLKNQNQVLNKEEMDRNYKTNAEWNIKWYLIKDKIIEEESIDVSDSEVKNKIDQMISENIDNKQNIVAYFKDDNNYKNLFNEMLNDKLFEYLSYYAKVKVIEESTNELRKKQAA